MNRNLQLFNQALRLRKMGKSYSDICKEIQISKSTLSYWFTNKKWSNQIQNTLVIKNKKSNLLRLKQLSALKTVYKLRRYEEYKKEAREEYIILKNNPLFLSGISLYWGEGEKTENGRVSVINTDVEMIQVIVAFYRKVLHVPDNKLRAALFLYYDHNERILMRWWSNKINIPMAQFIKSQVLPSRSTLTKRKTKYGMCTVYFSDTKINVKIREWIKLVGCDMRV